MKKFEDNPEAVYVRWVDSANLFQDRWATYDKLDECAEEMACTTLGWLVAESEHSLYIASSIAPEEIGSVMQIPKSCVKFRTTVFGHDSVPDGS